MIISAIAAVSEDGVIGYQGKLPWSLPADLKRFRATTWGKPIIMGRKTHESLGKVLPGRVNIVLTRDSGLQARDCLVARNPDEALRLAMREGAEEAVVIGGSEVFGDFLPRCSKLYLTVVEGEFEGDAYFPMRLVEPLEWEIIHEEFWPIDERNRHPARYRVLQRRNSLCVPEGSSPK